MGKTYWKLIRRSIKENTGRFISIFTIVALGSGFLAGLLAAPPGMENRTDQFLDAHNMYDISIKGTLGITEEDVEVISNIDEVSSAYGVNSREAILEDDLGNRHVARITAVPENTLELSSGKFPKDSNEAVIEIINPFSNIDNNIKTLKLAESQEKVEGLLFEEFSVTGIVETPFNIAIKDQASQEGNGDIALEVFVHYSAFEDEYFTDMHIQLTEAKNASFFDDEYDKILDESMDIIEVAGEVRSDLRTEEILTAAQKELDEGQVELDAEKNKGKAEIAKAKAEVTQGEKELSNSEIELEKAKEEIASGELALANGEVQLAELENQLADIPYLSPEEGAQIQAAYDAAALELSEQRSILEKAKNEVNIGEEEISAGEAELESGRAELYVAESEMNTKIAAAQTELDEAAEEIDNMEGSVWYYFDREDNPGLSSYRNDVGKVRSISGVFPVFFFAVTVLVALTTLSRKIEEERTQIGALKSLGFSNRSIFANYLIYCLAASSVGSIVGTIIGFKVFPTVMDRAYAIMYTLPVIQPEIMLNIGLPIALIITFAVSISSYFSVRGALKERPAKLLFPKPPKLGKRILLERLVPVWSRLSFSHKVTLRNIFRYKKRLLMTVIGIAGSFALLLCAFGLKDSISDIITKQYDEINKADFYAFVTEEKYLSEDKELSSIINNKEVVASYETFSETNGVITNGQNEIDLDTAIVVPSELDTIDNYYGFRTRTTGEKIILNEESFIISEKMSEVLGVEVGEEVELEIENGEKATFKVTGIAENYIRNEVVLSKEKYESAYSEKLEYLSVQGILNFENDNAKTEVEKALGASVNINYFVFTAAIEKSIGESIESINYIVILIIVCSGLLIGVVLYNLININICERKKELATIEVLGFYNKEVYSYIFRETNLLCMLGAAVGIPLGIIFHQFIVRVIEVDDTMFGREIYGTSYLYSLLIATIFVVSVNLIMRKSIKEINMVEAMKAND